MSKKLKPSWWDEFIAFAVKGNAMALAVGTIIGGAFSTITKSLTNDLIMPVVNIFLGGADFSEAKIALPRMPWVEPTYELVVNEAGEVDKSARINIFGADTYGTCIFSRILYGSRVSLTVPFVSAAISFFLGILLGGISGYFGGIADNVIQRVIEVLSAIPSIPLWLALSAAIPPDISVSAMYLYITIILSFIGWTGLARVVRGKFISLRNEDFVMAAKLAGVSDFKIIVKHMVPGFLGYLSVNLTLGIPGSILGETSMSYLGLGMKAPATSWGVLLQETQDLVSVAQRPWKMIPLLFVIVTVLAFNFLGDGMRDAADPYK